MEQNLIANKRLWFHTSWINILIGFSIYVFMRLELVSSYSLYFYLSSLIQSVGIYLIVVCLTIGKMNAYIRYGFSVGNYEKGWVSLSIMVACLERILTMYMVYFQEKYGMGFQIGGNQVTGLDLHFDHFFITGVIAPIFEEFLFRVVMFALFAWFIHTVFKSFKLNALLNTNISWFDVYNLKSKVCWVVIIVSSTVFSLMHGPDLSSFHFYALGGLVGAVLFLKFGYWAAVVQHFAYNYLTYLFFVVIELIGNLF
ncbi:MAG TPA: hypothetical protein DCY20_03150 [Firmicutes bacterium]|nr:hypothetical protein [Bacillota bacterium]